MGVCLSLVEKRIAVAADASQKTAGTKLTVVVRIQATPKG